MRTPIGEMREIVAILTPTLSSDEAGGEQTTWTAGSAVHAAIRPLSAKEQEQFGQINAEVSHVLFGHWHDFNAVSSAARIRDLVTLDEYEIAGPPLNSPKHDHTRLNLIWRENP